MGREIECMVKIKTRHIFKRRTKQFNLIYLIKFLRQTKQITARQNLHTVFIRAAIIANLFWTESIIFASKQKLKEEVFNTV
jgi:hypothetical protein